MEVVKNKNITNPGWAAVLSFIFTGVGQIYNGEIAKGLCLMSLSITGLFAVLFAGMLAFYALLSEDATVFIWFKKALILLAVGIFVIAVVGAYSIYDAYKTANKKNKNDR